MILLFHLSLSVCVCVCACAPVNGLIVKRNAANLFIKRFLFIKENTIKDGVY